MSDFSLWSFHPVGAFSPSMPHLAHRPSRINHHLTCVFATLQLHPPQLRKPHYQVLLGDTKLDRIIVQPTRISDIPLPRSDGLPSEPREFTLQFQAPPQANLYSFVLFACSDTFLGCDVSLPVMVCRVLPLLPPHTLLSFLPSSLYLLFLLVSPPCIPFPPRLHPLVLLSLFHTSACPSYPLDSC